MSAFAKTPGTVLESSIGMFVFKPATFLSICTLLVLLISCREDGEMPSAELSQELQSAIELATGNKLASLRMPASDELDEIPQDPNNRLTPQKVALGKLLFHETGLAVAGIIPGSAGTYSCASCHHAGAGFQAGRVQGLSEGALGFGRAGEGRVRAANVKGDDVDAQPVRSPAALNVAYQKVMLFNGQFGATGPNEGTEAQWTAGTPKAVNELGFDGVETQAIAGLKVHRMDVTPALVKSLGYQSMFDEAFADVPPAERYNRTTAGLAIAAFERTILASEAPFQRWLGGDQSALSAQELRGGIVFFGEGQCASCHSGPSLATMSFHALGMSDLHDCPEEIVRSTENMSDHKGRGGFTMRGEDMFKFKTPQLYNLTDSKFYGHGSSFRSVRDVVAYKVKAESQNRRVSADKISPVFVPLGLSSDQQADLVAFLEDALHDDKLSRYVPERLNSGNCFPVADAMAKMDLGCD